MRYVVNLLVLIGIVTLAGCASTGANRQQSGAALGSVNPQLVEVLGDGLIGTITDAQLSSGERKMALEAEYRALEYGTTGDPVKWRNLWSGRSGEVLAAQPYRVGAQDCRPYSHTLTGSGVPSVVRGTACRNPDGSWTPLI